MNRMKVHTLHCLLAAGSLLLAGCGKQDPSADTLPGAIRFTASAEAAGTKTAYSGVVTNGVERIDWAEGDRIRIYSDKAVHRNAPDQPYADYTVSSVGVDPSNAAWSRAGITPAGGNGLVWGSTPDTYTFYGIYPVTDCADGASGILCGTIDADQGSGDPAVNLPKYGCLTAARQAALSADVELPFAPAFTAFEFHITSDTAATLLDFTISSASGPLSGPFTVTYTGLTPAYSTTGTGRAIRLTFPTGVPVSPAAGCTFTVFALPLDILTDLRISFTARLSSGTQVTRSLPLNDASGPVPFSGRRKHIITADMKAGWSFSSITLNGVARAWETPALPAEDSDRQPQAGQFEVSGAGITRLAGQTWLLGSHTATVSFKVLSPENGTWEVVPQGAADRFTVTYDGQPVTGPFTGHIAAHSSLVSEPVTRVEFQITPRGAGDGDRLWFRTYATGADGIRYSLDSETQLYDVRGYHYFQATAWQ